MIDLVGTFCILSKGYCSRVICMTKEPALEIKCPNYKFAQVHTQGMREVTSHYTLRSLRLGSWSLPIKPGIFGFLLQVAAFCAKCVQKKGEILSPLPVALHGLPADMDRHRIEGLTLRTDKQRFYLCITVNSLNCGSKVSPRSDASISN